MISAFIICSIVTCIFLLIGVSAWKSKEAVGFFTGVKPPKMENPVAYNHAVAKLWFVFAVAFEIMGIPLLFIEQNSPIALLFILGVVILIIALIVAYIKVETKYRV